MVSQFGHLTRDMSLNSRVKYSSWFQGYGDKSFDIKTNYRNQKFHTKLPPKIPLSKTQHPKQTQKTRAVHLRAIGLLSRKLPLK